MECLCCGAQFNPDTSSIDSMFYCDRFCEDIGWCAYWFHWIERPNISEYGFEDKDGIQQLMGFKL